MLYNLKNNPSQKKFDSKVCIIGAGAAGISLARALADKKISVCLLEAGDLEPTDESDSIYESSEVTSGPVGVKNDFSSSYPSFSRLRYFGGSTNHWGGWCRPLESWDFEERPWLEKSGWPLQRKELVNHYKEAQGIVDIPAFDLDNEQSHPEKPFNSDDKFSSSEFPDILTRYFHFSPPTRFKDKYFDELKKSPYVKIFLNANATEVSTTSDGQVADRVTVKNYNNRKYTFKANIIVLACGGLENPRLLLNFARFDKSSFGNQSDCVGRYFMDHPGVQAGLFANYSGSDWLHNLDFNFNGLQPKRALVTSADFQFNNQTLNFSCTVENSKKPPEGDAEIQELFKQTNPFEEGQASKVTLIARTEMEPRASNRVSLSNDSDQLGLKKIAMNIEYSELDRWTFSKSVEAVIRHLSFLGKGRGQWKFDPKAWPQSISGGCHHMGTTRMSENSSDGVVDKNCRIHGMKNMFVAGSSVFSTGGFANPTLTIVALALRLADFIEKEVKK